MRKRTLLTLGAMVLCMYALAFLFGCEAHSRITGQSASAQSRSRSLEMSVSDTPQPPKPKTVKMYQVIVEDAK